MMNFFSGCGAVRLAHHFRVVGAAGSNPVIPTKNKRSGYYLRVISSFLFTHRAHSFRDNYLKYPESLGLIIESIAERPMWYLEPKSFFKKLKSYS